MICAKRRRGLGDRSLPPAVRETGRRSVGNRKERLWRDYASSPGRRPQRIPYPKKNAVSEQAAQQPTIETSAYLQRSFFHSPPSTQQKELRRVPKLLVVLWFSQIGPVLSFVSGIAMVAFGSAAILAWALREWGRWAADPGNSHSRAIGAPCDSRRFACLFPPLAAAGSGPPNPSFALRLRKPLFSFPPSHGSSPGE